MLYKNGTSNPYDRSVFMELCYISKILADLTHLTKPAV